MTSVSRALYRSLLRSSRIYGQSPALCSLLHRTGRADLWDPAKDGPYHGGPEAAAATAAAAAGGPGGNGGPTIPDEELQSIHLPPDSARDLTRGYDDLRRSHYRHTRAADRGHQLGAAAESDDVLVQGEASDDGSIKISIIRGDDLEEIEEFNLHELEEGSNRNSRTSRRPSHEVLFRKLLQDLLGDGDAQMRFPSHVVANDDSQRLEEIVRREFHARSLGEWKSNTSGERKTVQDRPTEVSAYFTDTSRREAAFLALRELNKKLVWAESMGMLLGKNCNKNDDSWVTKRQHQQQQAAKHVEVLPTRSPSSYLRAGTFLVAHPLLSGYFAKAVIAILEHTEPHITTTRKDTGSDGSDDCLGEGDQYGSGGGTYGVIVNRLSYSSIPNESGGPRPRALREVLRPDCIPPILRRAFGDSVVREGGPVNVSVQMMHTASPELEEELKLGGMVLPMVLSDDRDEQVGEVLSAAVDSDSAVYFNSDLIKAAQSVIDGKMEREDFSFFVGASVWTVGQLQREIEQGFWIPCRGPPQMAYTGMCEHSEVDLEGENERKKTEASGDGEVGQRKKTQSRPKPDLWLSMLSAVGEHEAELAELVGQEDDVGKDPNNKACDWW